MFAATLLKIDPRGSGQPRLSSMGRLYKRMGRTEILRVTDWMGFEIAAAVHDCDARWWTRGGDGRGIVEIIAGPGKSVVAGLGKQTEGCWLLGAKRGASSVVGTLGSCERDGRFQDCLDQF